MGFNYRTFKAQHGSPFQRIICTIKTINIPMPLPLRKPSIFVSVAAKKIIGRTLDDIKNLLPVSEAFLDEIHEADFINENETE